DTILSPEYLQYIRQKINMDYGFMKSQAPLKLLIQDNSLEFHIEAMRMLAMEKFFEENASLADRLPEMILDAKETLRDPRRFYQADLLMDAMYVIEKSLEKASLPFHPARLSLNNFEQPQMMLETNYLIEYANSRNENMFYKFYERKLDEILEVDADLIGISINSFSQVLGGLTLARMLKERVGKNARINIGGNFFMRVKNTLMKRPEFFENFCHSISLGEGEKQVLIMVEELHKGNGFKNVPDLLYYAPDDEEKVKYTFCQDPEKLDNIGFQDPTGLPVHLYFTPDIVMCLQSSKGCYWGKCSFCDTDYGIKHDIKSLDRLIEEIKYSRDLHGVRNFEFIDESIRPGYMRKMAQRFIDEGLNINWFCNGRLEDDFTPELLKLLHKSGLTMVLWGLESGSRRIHRLINKGVDFQNRFEVLKNAHNAKLWNFAYIFFGFPTETREEARKTIDTIIENKTIIDSYGRSVFTLGKHSILCREAEKFGILEVVEDSEELSTNLHYRAKTGMDDEAIDEMMKECTRCCAEAYDYNLWYYLRNRENIHLYLVKYGRDYVRNYKVPGDTSLTSVWEEG
ncbi:MAG: B12-binding domain-containing radical SAM protein, partial [Vulcanimicrobiota bacterium]